MRIVQQRKKREDFIEVEQGSFFVALIPFFFFDSVKNFFKIAVKQQLRVYS